MKPKWRKKPIIQVQYLRSILWFLFGSIRGDKRDEQVEGTALAKHTLHPDLSVMLFCDRADNGQTQPGAALRARFALAAAEKLLKQARDIHGGYADTGILHFELEALRAGLNPQSDRAMLGCVLDGILHQVVKRLLEQGAVGIDRFR